MDAETDTTGRFADHSTVLERVIDTFDRVILHAKEEAR